MGCSPTPIRVRSFKPIARCLVCADVRNYYDVAGSLHRVRWFVGTLNADKVMVVENEGVADWGRFFASQSMTDAAGTRRLMVGNIGHPHWMYGPNDIDIPVNVNNDAAKANANEINVNATNAPQWSHMISLPREVSIYPSSGALAFAPARELAAARQGAPFRVADLPVVSAAPPVPMGNIIILLSFFFPSLFLFFGGDSRGATVLTYQYPPGCPLQQIFRYMLTTYAITMTRHAVKVLRPAACGRSSLRYSRGLRLHRWADAACDYGQNCAHWKLHSRPTLFRSKVPVREVATRSTPQLKLACQMQRMTTRQKRLLATATTYLCHRHNLIAPAPALEALAPAKAAAVVNWGHAASETAPMAVLLL